MDDLNDLYYFVKVVEHGGFTQAGRALGMPKSKLSRRIAELEARFDVRLLQRTTRHFTITELGREFYERCLGMLAEAEAAQEIIERKHAEPQGVVRVSCPTVLLEYRISKLVARFMVLYPKVAVHLEATNRRVDLLSEGFDLALRVRFPPLEDSDLVMRVLGNSPQRLVVAPRLLNELDLSADAANLTKLPSLDWGPPRHHAWILIGPQGEEIQQRHAPRLVSDDMHALRDAALEGVGAVQLPWMVVEHDLRAGTLVDALPGWSPKGGIVHAVFPSRRGLLPRVRLLVDFLGAHIQKD